MAETSFGKIDHRVPLPQATVRHVGPGWASAAGRVDRSDPTSYMPLHSPGAMPAPLPRVEPPPPPTETELRAVLHERLLARDFTAAQAERAQATADRASALVERYRTKLESFANVDDETTAAVIEQLRSDAGRLELDDTSLRHRLAEREVARADLQASENARWVLVEARDAAQSGADAAQKAARTAAVAVAALEAQRMAEHILDLEDQAARERNVLLGFDRVSANTGLPLPPAVFEVVGTDRARLLRPVDASAWHAALDKLLGDATAEVSVEIPPRRPAPVLARYTGEIRHAVPIRPLQTEPAEEPEPEAEQPQTDIPGLTSAAPEATED